MSDRDHARAALEQLQRLDPTDLTDVQRSAHADAVAAVETLCKQLEETTEETDQTTAESDTPEEWDDEEWQDQIETAREKAAIPPSKGTLTTKTIDGRDYYYLQWREGDTVTSQYVGPVDPA